MPELLDTQIGARAASRRRELALPLGLVAEHVGVAPELYTEYEEGEYKFDARKVIRLSEILHVPVSWFYLDSPITPDPERAFSAASAEVLDENEMALVVARRRLPEAQRAVLDTVAKALLFAAENSLR